MPRHPCTVSEVIRERLRVRLQERRAVVWYDADQDCAAIFAAFDLPGLTKVDARSSALDARRRSDDAWRGLCAPVPVDAPAPMLLIYVPWRREGEEDKKTREPFEGLAGMASAFGDDDADSLVSIARTTYPDRIGDIERLCADPARRATLAQFDALGATAGFALVREALGSDSPIEVGEKVLVHWDDLRGRLNAAGVVAELGRLLHAAFGFEPPPQPAHLHDLFGRWVLFSEFAFDLDDQVPAFLAQVPRAGPPFQAQVYRLCDQLRGHEDNREAYLRLARQVEADLNLSSIGEEAKTWGRRDTFPAEDRAALRFVEQEALAGRLDVAQETIAIRRRSIWRTEEDRKRAWLLAARCIELLRAAARWQDRAVPSARPLREHLLAYQSIEDGLWGVDRGQRWVERAAADCPESGTLGRLLARARQVHKEVTEGAQRAFFDAALREGWPPEGEKQTQVFHRHVAPRLREGRRTAYFLVDALRFEMGRDLATVLEHMGEVKVVGVASVLPTSTPFGMAALLPGAEASYGYTLQDGKLVPTLGEVPVVSVQDREGVLRTHLGDRVSVVTLDDLLEATDERAEAQVGRAGLVVVRSDEIDRAPEHGSQASARRFMASVIDDIVLVAQRLARLGITDFVFATDHGHVFLPEVPAGDTLAGPEGEWVARYRRSRIGKATRAGDGFRLIPAEKLGIVGPFRDVALATGFRVFTAGSNYFHEGLSLQECLLPVVTLRAQATRTAHRGASLVSITYRRDTITSRVVLVKLKLEGVVPATLPVRVAAVELEQNRVIGQVEDCEARDPATGLISLSTAEEVAVAIHIDDRFAGPELAIQALDARGAGVVLGLLRLKNGCVD